MVPEAMPAIRATPGLPAMLAPMVRQAMVVLVVMAEVAEASPQEAMPGILEALLAVQAQQHFLMVQVVQEPIV